METDKQTGKQFKQFKLKAVAKSETGKQYKVKGVVYSNSPIFIRGLMIGFTSKIAKIWLSATLLVTPVVGTYWYVQNYKEQGAEEAGQGAGE